MQEFIVHINESIKDKIQGVLHPWACYILYQNEPLDRLGKTDGDGILYIGKTDDLYKRVASLQKSVLSNCDNNLKPKIRGHKSLSKKVFRIQKFLEPAKMTIKVIILPSYESILYAESYLLEKYVSIFGELPPLNGQYGNYELNESEDYLLTENIDLSVVINEEIIDIN